MAEKTEMAQQKEISVTGWAIASELCVWLVLFLFSADACVISSLWILREKEEEMAQD